MQFRSSVIAMEALRATDESLRDQRFTIMPKKCSTEGTALRLIKAFSCKTFLLHLVYQSIFLRGRTKLPAADRLEDITIASKRVHVERVIGYAKTYKILQGVIPYNLLPLSNRIVYICFMLVNFRNNIVD